MKTHQSNQASFFLILLCLITPLIHSKTALYGMNAHKTLAFWCFAEVSLVFNIWQKNQAIKRSLLNLSLIIYASCLVLTAIFGESTSANFLSTFARMDGVVSLLHFIVFALIFGASTFSTAQWKTLGLFSIGVALIVSIFGLFERNYADDGRIQSTLSNPLYVAIFLLFHVFVVLIFITNLIKKKLEITKSYFTFQLGFLVICLFIFLYVIIYTKSRAAFMALTLGLMATLVVMIFLQKELRKFAFIGLICSILPISLLYFGRQSVFVNEHPALSRLTNFSTLEQSLAGRKSIMQLTANGLSDRPILGWGKEGFNYFFTKHYQPKLFNDAVWYDRAHNFILDKWIEGGFLLLVAYCFLIISVFITIFKKTNLSPSNKSLLAGALVTYLTFNLFMFDCFAGLLCFFMLLIFVGQQDTSPSTKSISLKPVIKICLSGILMLMSYQFVIKSFQIIKQWTLASKSVEITSFINNFQKTYNDAFIGKYDIAIDFALAKDRVQQGQFDETIKQQYFKASEQMLLDILKTHPNHPIILTHLGFSQFALDQNKGIKTYELLKTIAPKRQTNLMDLATFYLQNGKHEKAIQLYQDVYKLDTTYQTALLYKAYGMALKGEDKSKIRQVIDYVKMEEIAKRPDFVANIFIFNNDLAFFVNKVSQYENKSMYSQQIYYVWLKAALQTSNEKDARLAIYAYNRHYFDPNQHIDIDAEMEAIISKRLPPERLLAFFDRFPNR